MLSPYTNMRFNERENAWELVMGSHVLSSVSGHPTIEDGHRAWVEMVEGLEPGMKDFLDIQSKKSVGARTEETKGGNGTAARVSRNLLRFR